MTGSTDINPIVLAESVLDLLKRSGRPRSDGLSRTIEVEQESGEPMTFTMLASDALDAAHVARVKVWLADRLVLGVELGRHEEDHVVHTFDEAEWAHVLLGALIFDEDAARAPRSDDQKAFAFRPQPSKPTPLYTHYRREARCSLPARSRNWSRLHAVSLYERNEGSQRSRLSQQRQ